MDWTLVIELNIADDGLMFNSLNAIRLIELIGLNKLPRALNSSQSKLIDLILIFIELVHWI